MPYCWTRLTCPTPFPGVPDEPKTLGERVRRRRMELRMLQRELAEVLGVTETTVNNWERGRTEPGPSQAPRVVAWLTGT